MEEMERDEQTIRDESSWLMWPRLPMVRTLPNGEKELGVLFSTTGAGHYPLFKMNVFKQPKDTDIPCLYPSPASIVEDGWRVD